MHAERSAQPAIPMPARAWLLAGLLVLAGTLTLRLAHAAPPATQEHEKQALALATEARNHYHDKDFTGAAELYMQAYARMPEPTLLFNAARAYEDAGKLREALPLFHLYLSVNRHDDAESRAGRKDAETHLADIEARLKAAEAQATPIPPTPPVDAPPKPPVEATPPDAQPTPEPPAKPTTPPADTPSVYRPGLFERVQHPPEDASAHQQGWSTQRKAAVAAGAVGGALLVAGAVVAGIAAGDLDFIDNYALVGGGVTLHPTVTQRQADAAFATHAARKAWAGGLIGVGAVALGTGIVLWLIEPTHYDAPAARLWPSIDIGAGGVTCALGGRF